MFLPQLAVYASCCGQVGVSRSQTRLCQVILRPSAVVSTVISAARQRVPWLESQREHAKQEAGSFRFKQPACLIISKGWLSLSAMLVRHFTSSDADLSPCCQCRSWVWCLTSQQPPSF